MSAPLPGSPGQAPSATKRASAKRAKPRGVTLVEIILALGVLAVGVLTLIGYMATIHRAAREGKNQAMATMHARSILERIRDSASDFDMAASPTGFVQSRLESVLPPRPNSQDVAKGATVFDCVAKTSPLSVDIYSVVVKVRWPEAGRTREVVLESRAQRPRF